MTLGPRLSFERNLSDAKICLENADCINTTAMKSRVYGGLLRTLVTFVVFVFRNGLSARIATNPAI